MKWDVDESGAVKRETVELTMPEIWRRGWHRHPERAHPLLRDAIKKAMDEYEAMKFQIELRERFGDRKRRTDEEMRAAVEAADRARLGRLQHRSRG